MYKKFKVISILVCIILGGILLSKEISLEKRLDNVTLNENIVESVGEDDTFNVGQVDDFSVPIESIDSLLNNQILGFVYFGRDTCPMCLQFNKALAIEVKKIPGVIIYKFDTDRWRENEKFQKVLDKYDIKNIPCLIRITNSHSFILGSGLSEEISQSDLHMFLTSY